MNALIAFLAGIAGAIVVLLVAGLRQRRRETRRPITIRPEMHEATEKRRLESESDAYRERTREKVLRPDYKELEDYRSRLAPLLLQQRGVVGIGIGTRFEGEKPVDRLTVSVFVEEKIDPNELGDDERISEQRPDIAEIRKEIFSQRPSAADDPLIDVVETGEGRELQSQPPPGAGFFPTSKELNLQRRPVVGGLSIGLKGKAPGTLGVCCYSAGPLPLEPDHYYVLSNNHVLADLNQVPLGEAVLQPGEGGVDPKAVAWLADFVELKFVEGQYEPPNYADAAIAAGHFADLDSTVYWAGNLDGCDYTPAVGDEVQKTGARTGFTRGKITHVGGTFKFKYSNGKEAWFHDVIVTERITDAGDSGSLLVNSATRRAVGLLFYDSPSKNKSYANSIFHVEELLQIRIGTAG